MQNPLQAQALQHTTQLQLEDIHLPAAPPLWPPAWGWWVLLALLLATGIILVKMILYRRFRRYQQGLLNALAKLEQQLHQDNNTKALGEINILLRRLALMYYPRQQVASLVGNDWLAFLDSSSGTQDFSQGAGRLLADTPYLATIPQSADTQALIAVVKNWVSVHSSKEAVKNRKTNSKQAAKEQQIQNKQGVKAGAKQT